MLCLFVAARYAVDCDCHIVVDCAVDTGVFEHMGRHAHTQRCRSLCDETLLFVYCCQRFVSLVFLVCCLSIVFICSFSKKKNKSLVITLAGAMAQVLSFFQRIVEQPSLVPELLGKAVPQQAFFFCFYIAQV